MSVLLASMKPDWGGEPLVENRVAGRTMAGVFVGTSEERVMLVVHARSGQAVGFLERAKHSPRIVAESTLVKILLWFSIEHNRLFGVRNTPTSIEQEVVPQTVGSAQEIVI
jgi:hypothetical protein